MKKSSGASKTASGWEAQPSIDGKRYYLGHYETKDEAMLQVWIQREIVYSRMAEAARSRANILKEHIHLKRHNDNMKPIKTKRKATTPRAEVK